MTYLEVGQLIKYLKLFDEGDCVSFKVIGHNKVNVEAVECTFFPGDDEADQRLKITLAVDDSE